MYMINFESVKFQLIVRFLFNNMINKVHTTGRYVSISHNDIATCSVACLERLEHSENEIPPPLLSHRTLEVALHNSLLSRIYGLLQIEALPQICREQLHQTSLAGR